MAAVPLYGQPPWEEHGACAEADTANESGLAHSEAGRMGEGKKAGPRRARKELAKGRGDAVTQSACALGGTGCEPAAGSGRVRGAVGRRLFSGCLADEASQKMSKQQPTQFINPETPGYVGFANLPNQVHRKSVKKGFEFTLMVVAPPHARDDCKDAGTDADADADRGWRWCGSRASRVRPCARSKKSQLTAATPATFPPDCQSRVSSTHPAACQGSVPLSGQALTCTIPTRPCLPAGRGPLFWGVCTALGLVVSLEAG
ncbi:hypothetical protein H8959_012618 [Pygathrix nigripes]